jgi:ribonuclease BN (tRNA processing enzyme)
MKTLLLTILLVASGGSLATEPGRCPPEGNWLQVLGSGGPELQDRRASSGYLVWIDGQARLLVDAGGGVALRFGQAGAEVGMLDAVVFSHLHVDHSSDFPALVKSSFFEGRERELPVFGPDGNRFLPSTRDFLQRLFAGKQGLWPYLSHFLPGERHFAYEISPVDVDTGSDEPQQVWENERIRLSAVRAHHGPLPALSWRVDIRQGGSVTFSGDMSGKYGLLPVLARDSSLLVAHHAIAEDTTGVGRLLHMPPSVIGDLAARSKADRLILSHRMLRSLGREQESLALIRKRWPGPVDFAEDLACYPID